MFRCVHSESTRDAGKLKTNVLLEADRKQPADDGAGATVEAGETLFFLVLIKPVGCDTAVESACCELRPRWDCTHPRGDSSTWCLPSRQ